MKNCVLITPEAKARQDSLRGTFVFIPGDYVKIRRGNDEYSERFWVTVEEMDMNTGLCRGVVDNDLEYTAIHGLECNDAISFYINEVLQVMK